MSRKAASRLPTGKVMAFIARSSPAPERLTFVHRLQHHAREHALGAVLAAVAGPFYAAKRGVRAADHVAVDAHHAALELRGEALLALVVAGPRVSREAVRQAVGLGDHLGLVRVGI